MAAPTGPATGECGLRGWTYYFRHDVAKRTFAYLDAYAWHRVWRWVQKKHPKTAWKTRRRRYAPGWVLQEDGVELFRPSRVPIVRYRFKGTVIPLAWNGGRLETDRRPDRGIAYDDARAQERLNTLLTSLPLGESRMR